jgi:hypothetical protein
LVEYRGTLSRIPGHPILPSGITKIENGDRGVDVGDLVALASVLSVNPNRLLLPKHADAAPVALAPGIEVTAGQAWRWADGTAPLLAAAPADSTFDEVFDEFRRDARPAEFRLRDDHTAMQAARDVVDRLTAVLDDRAGGPLLAHPNPGDVSNVYRRLFGDPATALRRALARLTAEVEDLLEQGKGTNE